jgi:AcrR family transcriptional regulator
MARRRKKVTAARLEGSRATSRDKIIGAFLALLAEKRFEQIELVEVAARAGVSLAVLREEFGSTLAILAAHMREIDRAVLAGIDKDMADEPARERLFDVLMRRLELLEPHKEAVRSLMRSALRNPPLALALNALAVRSQQWMLAAARIGAAGPIGQVRAQGLALLFANVLRTWVDDHEPGLPRTLAALDRALASGERWGRFLDDLCTLPQRICPSRGPQTEARGRGGGRGQRPRRGGDAAMAA